MHRRRFFQKNYNRQQLSSGVYICRPCHSGIHALFDEMTLAKRLNKIEDLLRDEAVLKHCHWVARQRTDKLGPELRGDKRPLFFLC
jgi:hypothetical protein